VSGTKVLLRDSAWTDERSLIVVAKDSGIVAPAGSAQDPTVGGARLELFNDVTGERAFVDLPAAHWTALGNPAGSAGYKYKDAARVSGPCKVARLYPERMLKAVCRGAEIAFTLNETAQGNVRVSLRSGAGTGGLKYCARFGGEVAYDHPTNADESGLFKATKAPAPMSCPR
jgi:hypothetical protein